MYILYIYSTRYQLSVPCSFRCSVSIDLAVGTAPEAKSCVFVRNLPSISIYIYIYIYATNYLLRVPFAVQSRSTWPSAPLPKPSRASLCAIFPTKSGSSRLCAASSAPAARFWPFGCPRRERRRSGSRRERRRPRRPRATARRGPARSCACCSPAR